MPYKAKNIPQKQDKMTSKQRLPIIANERRLESVFSRSFHIIVKLSTGKNSEIPWLGL